MFSATMAPKIRQLAKQILKDPEEISVAISKPAEGVTQKSHFSARGAESKARAARTWR